MNVINSSSALEINPGINGLIVSRVDHRHECSGTPHVFNDFDEMCAYLKEHFVDNEGAEE